MSNRAELDGEPRTTLPSLTLLLHTYRFLPLISSLKALACQADMATLLSTRSLRRLSPHQPFLRGVHDYIRCQTPGGESLVREPIQRRPHHQVHTRSSINHQKPWECMLRAGLDCGSMCDASSRDGAHKQVPGRRDQCPYTQAQAFGDPTIPRHGKIPMGPVQGRLDVHGVSGRLLWDIRWASRLGRAQRLAADGRHGGKEVSTYLKDNLPGLIESVDSNGIDDLVKWTRNTHGGYYKRWRGGGLQRWTQYATGPTPEPGSEMTLEERLTLAFLEVSSRTIPALLRVSHLTSLGR
jgi:hypothetical protein